MTDHIIIRTNGEQNALIPDRWVLGTGLSTETLYAVHTDAPLMIVQCPVAGASPESQSPCTVYLSGDTDPERFNRLFAEAWRLLEIYKERPDRR